MLRNLLEFWRDLWGAFTVWACPCCEVDGERWEAQQW